jgi:uncharacterized protein (DUF433 family)
MKRATKPAYILRYAASFHEEPAVKGVSSAVGAAVHNWRPGPSPEKIIASLPHLTVAQVHDALGYFNGGQGEKQEKQNH